MSVKNPAESGHYIIRGQDAVTVAYYSGGDCWQVIGDDSTYHLKDLNLSGYEKINLE